MKMKLETIYKNRFEATGIDFRNKMWKVLCTHFFQKYINKDDVVLDLPCGYGEFINNIQAKKKIAIDLNPDASKYLRKSIKFINASSNKTTLEKNSVDVIFVSNFFEHITREQIISTIKEFKRILKKNGKVIILQPNIRFCAKDYWMFFDHITPIDDRALDEVFEINDFKLTYKIEKFLPYSTKSSLPKNVSLIKLYIKAPFLWHIFGKQSLLVFTK